MGAFFKYKEDHTGVGGNTECMTDVEIGWWVGGPRGISQLFKFGPQG